MEDMLTANNADNTSLDPEGMPDTTAAEKTRKDVGSVAITLEAPPKHVTGKQSEPAKEEHVNAKVTKQMQGAKDEPAAPEKKMKAIIHTKRELTKDTQGAQTWGRLVALT